MKKWPEFNGANAISLPRGNGIEHIFFGEDAKNVTPEAVLGGRCLELTRISHQIVNGREVLSGLYVNENDRGRGIGMALVGYFIDNSSRASAEFGGTTLIHKPGIAILLERNCLYPRENDFEIAFPNNYKDNTTPNTPDVIIVKDTVEPSERGRRVRRTNHHGENYRVVGKPGWGERPSRSMPKAYLHTKYTP